MGTLVLGDIKKKACGFLQEKYKTARLALTDVTHAELLAEEATNNDPWGPDAKTMTAIAAASFCMDDYWRITTVIRRRLYDINWKQWRQFYKTLVLLEFLLTHGPQHFAEEFQSAADVIQELGTFRHLDEKGFDWGSSMQEKSNMILNLLAGGSTLKEARLKALKITKEIQGFGNSIASPSTSSSSLSSYTGTPRTSSFHSYSTGSPRWNGFDDQLYTQAEDQKLCSFKGNIKYQNIEDLHMWDCPTRETGSLLDIEEEEHSGRSYEDEEEEEHGLIATIFSKLGVKSVKVQY